MNKKLMITTAVILLISCVLFVVGWLEWKNHNPKHTLNNSELGAIVRFNPSQVSVPVLSPKVYAIDIFAESLKTPLTGIQIQLSYLPQIVRNITFVPTTDSSSYFSKNDVIILHNSVNPVLGDLSYSVGLLPGKKAKIGKGKVGVLLFRLNYFSSITEAKISFTGRTLATTTNSKKALLKSAQPLIIKFIFPPKPPVFLKKVTPSKP